MCEHSPTPLPEEELPPPTPEEEREIEGIFHRFGGEDNFPHIYTVVDAMLGVLHQRAQSLIGLAGVVITVTGFSGRIIADTSRLAQILIISGLGLVGLGAGVTLMFVMPIRWVTSYMHLPPKTWLLAALRRRDRKSRALKAAAALVTAGMLFYLGSIALMLFFPEATELKRVR